MATPAAETVKTQQMKIESMSMNKINAFLPLMW